MNLSVIKNEKIGDYVNIIVTLHYIGTIEKFISFQFEIDEQKIKF